MWQLYPHTSQNNCTVVYHVVVPSNGFVVETSENDVQHPAYLSRLLSLCASKFPIARFTGSRCKSFCWSMSCFRLWWWWWWCDVVPLLWAVPSVSAFDMTLFWKLWISISWGLLLQHVYEFISPTLLFNIYLLFMSNLVNQFFLTSPWTTRTFSLVYQSNSFPSDFNFKSSLHRITDTVYCGFALNLS